MIGTVLTGAFLGIGALLALPVVTFSIECLLGATERRKTQPLSRPEGSRAVVVIPAHNEAVDIADTIEALRSELSVEDSVVVVADNCSDNTATIARSVGVTVIERTSHDERGKGYALHFAKLYLEQQTQAPDVVLILDADCRFSRGSVNALVASALADGRPIQSAYDLSVSAEADTKTRIGAFAFRVKNNLRPRGLSRLGLPRQLAGTGMAFPWAVYRDAPNMRGHITEDLVMGLELSLAGMPTSDCPSARVTSRIAPSAEGHLEQRERWETGHLATMKAYVPKLLKAAFRTRRVELLGLAFDLSVPPLALLSVSVAGSAVGATLSLLLGASAIAPAVILAESAAMGVAVLVAWNAVGKDILPLSQLVAVPLYVLWKLPSYFGFFLGRRKLGWVRAERSK